MKNTNYTDRDRLNSRFYSENGRRSTLFEAGQHLRSPGDLPAERIWGIDIAMHTTTFDVKTHSRSEMIDITDHVRRAVSQAGVSDGTATVYIPHTTAGVTINENADPDVVHDVLAALDEAVPWRQDFYQHGEGNSAAHVKSSLVGCSALVPVADGKLVLGTWQAVFFCEFDGPRTRRAIVSVSGG